jgi:hypothetical protein
MINHHGHYRFVCVDKKKQAASACSKDDKVHATL